MGLFSALHMGTQSLAAFQQGIEVAGHNLANVNTEGYSRQRISYVAANPETIYTASGIYSKGRGVDVTNITRINDEFLETELQEESTNLGTFNGQYDQYKIIETIFNEPSDFGISTALDNFFNSWERLAAPNPSDISVREEVKVASVQLADRLQQARAELTDLQDYIDQTLNQRVTEVNGICHQIASINDQIANLPSDVEPNDLLDKLDTAMLSLAEFTNFTASSQPNGTVLISISGSPVVSDNQTYELTAIRSSTTGFYEVFDGNNNNMATAIKGGEMYALLDMRDSVIPDYISDLDTMAGTLITEVNALHQSGYDLDGNPGGNFFEGSTAQDISVNASIINNPKYIAASSSTQGTEGDGTIANGIFNLRDQKLLNNSTYTISTFYQNTIAVLANDAGYIKNLSESQDIVLSNINQRKASVSGVSIDEEMAYLLQYEQAYTASAKFVSVVNEAIDVMMSMV